MKLARVLLPERATPALALACDGALYDVAELERRWRGATRGGDFFERVVAARCAGLPELYARLIAGGRPTEARIPEGEHLPLPPFDAARGAYLQLGPTPRLFQHRDARALVGDAQPTPLGATAGPRCAEARYAEVGLGLLLGEDLEAASEREAGAAVLGWTLLIDWTSGDPWTEPPSPQPPSQLGPCLVLRPLLAELRDKSLSLSLQGRQTTAALGESIASVASRLACVSRHACLRAGDLIGLGCAGGGRIAIAAGDRLSVELPGVMRLRGWAAGRR